MTGGSRVSTEPVTGNLVSLEGLLSELLVATVLDSVHFESMRVSVDHMVLGEEVGDGVHEASDTEDHSGLDLLIVITLQGAIEKNPILL